MNQRLLRYLSGTAGLLAIGLAFVLAPARAAMAFLVQPEGPAGWSTVRADLGALFLGVGGLALGGALLASRTALATAAGLLGLVIGGRLISLIADGPSATSFRSLLVELVVSGLLLATRRALVQPSPPMRRRSRVPLTLTAAALLLLAVGFLAQRPITLRLLERIVERNMTRQVVASLPDGLHVGLCGSGSPMPDETRSGPCVIVIAGRQVVVVDAGDGGPRTLALMGIPPGQVEAVLLTHFHSDHIGGLGELMLQRWATGSRTQPLPVHGPQGVESVVAGFNLAYGLDKGYRVAHHGPETVPPGGAGGTAVPFTIAEGATQPQVVLSKDGLTVTAFPVPHTPVFPAVGYRFDYAGRSVTISGDAAPSAALEAASRGVDVLMTEGLQTTMVAVLRDAASRHGRANLAKITADIPSYHTTPEDAARIAARAGARHLVFYHTIPPLPFAYMNAAFLGDAPRSFKGPITVSTDGLLLTLPRGTTTVTSRRLL